MLDWDQILWALGWRKLKGAGSSLDRTLANQCRERLSFEFPVDCQSLQGWPGVGHVCRRDETSYSLVGWTRSSIAGNGWLWDYQNIRLAFRLRHFWQEIILCDTHWSIPVWFRADSFPPSQILPIWINLWVLAIAYNFICLSCANYKRARLGERFFVFREM